ncbi:4526_t:CDS:2, partial [Entrophospora sp. SA101]
TRLTLRNGNIVRDAEMFPPHFWSVANNIEYAFPCTINSVEAWYRRLVGCEHLGIFKIIKEIQINMVNKLN